VEVNVGFAKSVCPIKHRVLVICGALPLATRIVWQAGPLWLVASILTTIVRGLAPTAVVWIGKGVLDAMVAAVQAGWGSPEVVTLYEWLAFQLLVLLGMMLVEQVNSFVTSIMGSRLSLHMAQSVLEKARSLDLATFEDPDFYDKITRARSESRMKALQLVTKSNSVMGEGITFLSMGTLVASLSTTLFLVMILACVPLLVVLVRYSETLYQMQYARTQESRRATYLSTIMTTRDYIPEIITLNLWSHLIQKWRTLSVAFLRQDARFARQRSIAGLGAGAIIAASQVGAAGYVVFLGMRRLSLSIGEMTMYSAAFAQGLNSLRQAVAGVCGIYEDSLFFHNLIEFYRLEPKIRIAGTVRIAPEDVACIEVQNVCFRYPGAQRYAVENLNITFRKSESTLLAGTNGAGKTTLIKLLMRLYEPDEGKILVNGIDIREFDRLFLYQVIGVIFQNYVRFAMSAGENIGYGFVQELENQNRIKAAAKMARAETIINGLPHKYDTILGKLFRNGQELSQGQWQRICLARLFMKDAPVLILDEPTASLDVETEVHLLNEIGKLTKDRICILVSHRAFRPGIADQIVILKNGQVAELGRYEDLVHRDGEFARLHRLYHGAA
jgi:ATP-binding cassette subfamily B protein